MKGRFAPSPSGRMHMGNIYAALLAWLSARSQEGGFVLRIEDIDPQRSKREFADQIRDDLLWLGIDWDEEYVQSERFHLYEQHLQILKEKGLTYPCYCTRADIMATQAPHESDGRVVYKGTCRKYLNTTLPSGMSENGASIRLVVPDKDIAFTDGHYGLQGLNLAQHCGDFILRRKDGAWAYQLAVVVDDALNGITEVVRGRDLLMSVPQQEYLFQLLGYDVPQYYHIPLLINETGQRLCKRDRSLDLGELRKHYSAQQLLGRIAFSTGMIDKEEGIKAKDLIPLFEWNKIPCCDIVERVER